jgi:hypothetical protein
MKQVFFVNLMLNHEFKVRFIAIKSEKKQTSFFSGKVPISDTTFEYFFMSAHYSLSLY